MNGFRISRNATLSLRRTHNFERYLSRAPNKPAPLRIVFPNTTDSSPVSNGFELRSVLLAKRLRTDHFIQTRKTFLRLAAC